PAARTLSLHDALPISAGPVTANRDTGVRIETLASDLALRAAESTSATISRTSGSPAASSSVAVGHEARWTEPSFHQLHTSSVTRSEEHTSELQSRENL